MKTVIPFPDSARIDEAAAGWIARLDRGNLDAGEREALRKWLAADSRHRRALERMAQLWGAMDCMAILAELFPRPAAPAPRRRLAWLPVAAAVVAVAVALGMMVTNTAEPTLAVAPIAAQARVYRTELGQRSVIPLADGSVLSLNTRSEARVRFDESARTVVLVHGEAHFKVAKEAARPFVVHAGSGSVRAVGTAFNVRLTDDRVEVLVDEGVVEVTPDEPVSGGTSATSDEVTASNVDEEFRRVQMKQGDALRYRGDNIQLQRLPPPAVERRLAWRSGKWIFEGETLAEVLAEVARHSDRRIILADPALASLRIGGYFDVGDIDGLMQALEAGFGIVVEREGDALHLAAGSRDD